MVSVSMNQQIDFSRYRSGIRGRRRTSRSHSQLIHSEEIHIRNYDHDWSYDLAIEIADSEGDVRFEERYFLQPQGVESVVGVVPDGEYEVRVTLDGTTEEAIHCRIDAAPENTVVVEIGNGTFGLTHGLRP